jgi:hypothetical protein
MVSAKTNVSKERLSATQMEVLERNRDERKTSIEQEEISQKAMRVGK